MTRYLALLRGINVGGHKKILMADLRALFESNGFTEVKSYIQSGNVIFNSEIENEDELIAKIETMIEDRFEFRVPVRIRTAEEFKLIEKRMPFVGSDYLEEQNRIAITFLEAEPAEDGITELDKLVFSPDKLEIIGREAYFYCPGGFARTKLTNSVIEKRLGVSATSRNMKTFMKIMVLLK